MVNITTKKLHEESRSGKYELIYELINLKILVVVYTTRIAETATNNLLLINLEEK